LQVGLPETDDMIYNLSLRATGNDFIDTLVGKETVKQCKVELPIDNQRGNASIVNNPAKCVWPSLLNTHIKLH